MKINAGRILAGAGAAALLVLPMVATTAGASAATGVSFANANFNGYSSGDEISETALENGTTKAVAIEEAFGGATTSSPAGLTSENQDPETQAVVQPAQTSSIHSYGRGAGLEVGLGTSISSGTDSNQIQLAGLAEQKAPPNSAAMVTKQIGPINLSPLADVSVLPSKAFATYSPVQCPIGEPLSYGYGSAANVTALSVVNPPVLSNGTTGAGNAVQAAKTESYTMLTPNSDGTFGLTSQTNETVAPLSVNLLNLFTVKVTVAGADPTKPITLASTASGEPGGASVKLLNGGLVTVTLTPAGGTPVVIERVNLNNPTTLGPQGFLHVDLSTTSLSGDLTSLDNAIAAILNGNQVTGPLGSLFGPGGPLNGLTSTAGSTVSSVLAKLADLSLGTLDIDAVPHAIGTYSTESEFQNLEGTQPLEAANGTQAAGAIDLVHLNLHLSGSALGVTLPGPLTSIELDNLAIGHLEASAQLSAPIDCTIPVIKTSNPPQVTAGNPFTYNIDVPNPSLASFVDCNLANVTVTDVITDVPGPTQPTFQVKSATATQTSPAKTVQGVITQTSPTSATVTWTGLSYPATSPPTTPILLSILVDVPKDSPSGTITDTATATGTVAGCTGGGTGSTTVGAGVPSGTHLTGSYTLAQPGVAAVAVSPAGASPAGAAPRALPFTGSMGGLWQPIAGVGVLGLGGGTLALVRRSRRRPLA